MWVHISPVLILTLSEIVQAIDLGWISIALAPSTYHSISTQNVPRCGKLCERQGRCVAATYDYRERTCHLHNSDVAIVESDKSGGRYLFKRFQQNSQNYDLKYSCDKDTQIAVPSAHKEEHSCYDIRHAYNASYLGCYKDTYDRDLDEYLGFFYADNSITTCIYFCYQSGYKYGSVQDANACLCGKTFGKYGKKNETSCNKPCTGNTNEICGGFWANSVYTTGL